MVENSIKPQRFEVYLINLNPTKGSEIQKVRPCVIVSPNELNSHLMTVIVSPMTTTIRKYPTRISLNFEGKEGQIVLDQIRTVDRSRLIKKLGDLESKTQRKVLDILQEMFSL